MEHAKRKLLPELFINLIVGSVLCFLIWTGYGIPSWWMPCVMPAFREVSFFIIAWFLLHGIWRYLRSLIIALDNVINVGPINLPIGAFASLLDLFHLWRLSDGILWIIIGVLFIPVLFFHLYTPLSFRSSEPMPIIKGFSVQYINLAIKYI